MSDKPESEPAFHIAKINIISEEEFFEKQKELEKERKKLREKLWQHG